MTPEQSGQGQSVLFVELKGGDAAEVLRPLLWLLAGQPGFGGGELLTSPDQPHLALVQARFSGGPPRMSLPEGARSWTFTVIEAVPR